MVGRDLRDWFVHFEALEDPRVERGKRHELNDIITIAVLAVISAGDGFTDMHTFAEAKLAWLKTFLKLPNGVPSHDTFGRVLAALDPDAFEQCLLQWTEALAAESGGPLVAIDGKTIRASVDKAAKKSAIHMVNAWCNMNHRLAQHQSLGAGSGGYGQQEQRDHGHPQAAEVTGPARCDGDDRCDFRGWVVKRKLHNRSWTKAAITCWRSRPIRARCTTT